MPAALLLIQARVQPAFLARHSNIETYPPPYYMCTLPSKYKRGTCVLCEKYQMFVFVIDFCQSSRGRMKCPAQHSHPQLHPQSARGGVSRAAVPWGSRRCSPCDGRPCAKSERYAVAMSNLIGSYLSDV